MIVAFVPTVAAHPDETTARFGSPTLDVSSEPVLRRELAAWLEHLGARRVELTVDLSAVEYVDSFGFEWLVDVVRTAPGRTRLTHARPAVRRLFDLHGLARLLDPEPRSA
ncbi:MAG: STAS domain-containing protein [Planctomycetia bacterium]